MQIGRAEARNMAFLMAAQAVAALVGILGFRLMGGWLSIVEFGRFGFAVGATLFFGLLAEFGIQITATREIACHPEQGSRIYKHGAIVRVVMALVSLGLLWGVSRLVPSWQGETQLLLLAGLVALTQFNCDPAIWLVFGRGRVDAGAVMLIFDRMIYLVGLYTGAYLLGCAEGLLLGILAANLLRMVVTESWVRLKLDHRLEPGWDRAIFKRLLGDGAIVGLAVVCFVAYGQSTLQLVKMLETPENLGYFAIAFGLVNSLVVLPTSLTTALFPTLAVRFSQSSIREPRLYEFVAKLNLLVAIPLAAVLIAFPEQVLLLWVGNLYTPSVPLVQILGLTVPLLALSFMYRIFFFAMNHPKAEALVSLAGMMAIVLLGVPLWQRYGIVGVASLFCLTELGVVLSKTTIAGIALGWPRYGAFLLRAGAVAAIAVVATHWLADWPWWIRGGAFLASIGGGGFALGLFPKEVLSLTRDMAFRGSGRVLDARENQLMTQHDIADPRPAVAVIGAGGHAKVVVSTLEAAGWPILGLFDDNEQLWAQQVLGQRVLGPISQLAAKPGTPAVIGIGSPAVRAKLAAALPMQWVTAIHPTAIVHRSVSIAPGAVIFAGAVVQPDATIGEHAVINTAATVDHDSTIEAFANIGPGVHLAGGVHIGQQAVLGIGCVVIPSIRIGSHSTLGAGSVAIRDIPDSVVAVGSPARVLRSEKDLASRQPESRAA